MIIKKGEENKVVFNRKKKMEKKLIRKSNTTLLTCNVILCIIK